MKNFAACLSLKPALLWLHGIVKYWSCTLESLEVFTVNLEMLLNTHTAFHIV